MRPISPAEEQRRLREYAVPTFGYCLDKEGAVVAEVFDGEIPEGWADSPAIAEKLVPIHPDPGPSIDSPYEDHSIAVLRKEVNARTGKGPKRATKAVDIVKVLEDLDVEFYAGEDPVDESGK